MIKMLSPGVTVKEYDITMSIGSPWPAYEEADMSPSLSIGVFRKSLMDYSTHVLYTVFIPTLNNRFQPYSDEYASTPTLKKYMKTLGYSPYEVRSYDHFRAFTFKDRFSAMQFLLVATHGL